MYVDRNGAGCPDPRTCLQGRGIFYSIQAGATAVPEVAVDRGPKSRFYIVTEMHFCFSDRHLRLNILNWRVCVGGKVCVVRGEEPTSTVGVQDQMAPTQGQTEFRFKYPSVRSIIDQLGGVILTQWGPPV